MFCVAVVLFFLIFLQPFTAIFFFVLHKAYNQAIAAI